MPASCTCEICGAPLTVPPSRLRQGPVRFCTRNCMRHAQKQGLLVCPTTSKRRTYHWEPWQLELLRTRYDRMPGRALQSLQEDVPFPRHAMQSKARALGLGRKLGTSARPWTAEEGDDLHTHLATMSLARLAQKLRRTKVAVHLKAR